VLQEFLKTKAKSNTQKVYRAGLLEFFDFIYGKIRKGQKAKKQEFQKYEELAEKYIQELKNGRNFLQDLYGFASHLHNKPPYTAKAFMAGIKNFLFFNGFEVSMMQSRAIANTLPKGKTRTAEEEITKELLQKILSHMDVKGKALYTFLASTGCRIGEALQLVLSDVDLEKNQVTVRGEYTKTGEMRVCFFTREAKILLEEWLKVRDNYINSSVRKNLGLVVAGLSKTKNSEDDRLFPFTQQNAETMWWNALKKVGMEKFDKFTKRRTLHPHILRKWFLSQAKTVIPTEIAEALAGHSGYLSQAYRRYTKQQLRDFYKKAEPYLEIFSSGEIVELKQELDSERERLNGLTQQLNEALLNIQKLMLERDELWKTVNYLKTQLKQKDLEYSMAIEQIRKEFGEILVMWRKFGKLLNLDT